LIIVLFLFCRKNPET